MQDRPLFCFFRALLALFKASKRVSSNFLPLIKITHWITNTYTSSTPMRRGHMKRCKNIHFLLFLSRGAPQPPTTKKHLFPPLKMHASQEIISPFFQRKECILSAPIIPYLHRKKRLFSREKQSQKETFLQIFHFLIDFSFLGLI